MKATLIYINPLAARFAHKSPILEQLTDKIGKNYTLFRMLEPFCAPDALIESEVAAVPQFSHGVSWSQFERAQEDGGIFINAMMEGLMYDPDLWVDLIQLPKNPESVALYIGIPYELYQECAGEHAYDKETYDYAELSTKTIVELLNQSKMTALH